MIFLPHNMYIFFLLDNQLTFPCYEGQKRLQPFSPNKELSVLHENLEPFLSHYCIGKIQRYLYSVMTCSGLLQSRRSQYREASDFTQEISFTSVISYRQSSLTIRLKDGFQETFVFRRKRAKEWMMIIIFLV